MQVLRAEKRADGPSPALVVEIGVSDDLFAQADSIGACFRQEWASARVGNHVQRFVALTGGGRDYREGRARSSAVWSVTVMFCLSISSMRAIARAVISAISPGSGGPSTVRIRMALSAAVGTDRVVLSQRFQVASGLAWL